MEHTAFQKTLYTSAAVQDHWKTASPGDGINVPIGWNPSGQLAFLDLNSRNQGPHCLFYGASSEKCALFLSRYLQTLAIHFSPEDIQFFIFEDDSALVRNTLGTLPHMADYAASSSERMQLFRQWRDELQRRQHLFNKYGVNHFNAHARAYRKGDIPERLPILIIAVNGSILQWSEQERSIFYECMRISRCLGIHSAACNQDMHNLLVDNSPTKIDVSTLIPLSERDLCSIHTLVKRHHPEKRCIPPANQIIPRKLWKHTFTSSIGEQKYLELMQADLCDASDEYDVVVCSAYKEHYTPTDNSLIGSLYFKKHLSVFHLAQDPALNFKSMGCWLSQETGHPFKRIACVELLDLWGDQHSDHAVDIIIQKTFSTLRYLLEQAHIEGIPVRTIALPILGSGDQRIEPEYILSTLIAQCSHILQTNSGVQKIILYEHHPQKAGLAADALEKAFSPKENPPRVFISYCSKQYETANKLRILLQHHQIPCWMAPESIPAGSNYLKEIPLALNQIDLCLLLLTQDAEQSPWVQKEVGTAIGSNKIVIPYQLEPYPISMHFQFLLNGVQIMPKPKADRDHLKLVETIRHNLHMDSGNNSTAHKTGLVLEGGGVRGIYTAGVLDVFMDHGLTFDGLIGVSAGAIHGCSYLSGQKGRSLRYYKNYVADPRFMSIQSLIKTGDLVGEEFCYHELPDKLDIYDHDAFRRNPTPYYAVCSNVDTGEAEYIRITDMREQIDVLRASASLPFCSRLVEIGGKRYLDGGCTDSIPIEKFREMGYGKNVVVLTRPLDYRKNPMNMALIKLFYRKFPKFVEALSRRHTRYNETVERILELEKAGEIFVIRPGKALEVGRLEKDPEKVQQVYNHGRADAIASMNRLKEWLNK